MFSTFNVIQDIAKLLSRKAPSQVEVVGAWGSAKTLTAVQAAQAVQRPLLFVTAGRMDAEAVHDDLATFVGEEHAALFPAWEVLPSDTMNPADDIVAERMNTLKRLATALETGEAMHTVTPVRALLQYVTPLKRLQADTVVAGNGPGVRP